LITVTLVDVRNPHATPQTANFEFFHMRDNIAVASNRAIDGVEILNQVSNITVKSVEVTNDNTFA
jgi:hypothetical protein